MPSILFWNVARAGQNGVKAEDLRETVGSFVDEYEPDCIVLCEMLAHEKLGKNYYLFGAGYTYLKPTRPAQAAAPQGTKIQYYGDKNDLRIYAFAQTKNNGPQARLIETSANRPALLLTISNTNVLIFHARSVSQTSAPQVQEMKQAYDYCQSNNITPHAIFGDLNIDLQNTTRMQNLAQKLGTHALSAWNQTGSGKKTHKKKSELDWALTSQGFNGSVEIATVVQRRSVKILKQKDDKEKDWNGYAGLETTKSNSDHMPMVLSW